MTLLYDLHQQYLSNLQITFRRNLIDDIDWEEQLLAIQGARGVGKSTLFLQHIKETFGNRKEALFISMDNFALKDFKIYDIAKYHLEHGGSHLFIDEIHKYEDWSIELKSIYDLLPNLKVAFTSSSILQVYKGFADLSRRAITYELKGLSFREYLQIETKLQLKSYTLDEILQNHVDIAHEILKTTKPLAYFNHYLQYGYYPFYLKGKKNYLSKLNSVLNTILDVDIPYLLNVNMSNVFKIKKLISTLASEIPFQPNTTKLAASLDLSRSTLNTYLHYLDQACILNLLLDKGKYYSALSKPEKIYLNNSNLCYAISPGKINVGALREIFFMNQVQLSHQVNFSKQSDFIVDSKYIFEVGGHYKSYHQVADIENSYLAVDETEIGSGNRIPLWLFGFLY